MSFTAHNILLDDGTETKPGQYRLSQHPVCISTKRTLHVIYPNGFDAVRIVDLGCLEGGYTAEFARMGFSEALGIEVRENNLLNCMIVKNGLKLPNLHFVQDDVWNLENYGMFDVIFCCGILYHLAEPKRFFNLMSNVCRKAVIINTHFSTVRPIARHDLSEIAINEGLPGRWFAEPQGRDESAKWSAWGNDRSFWIQREYLIQTIHASGFAMVFEQFDCLGDDISGAMINGYYRTDNRSTFVGIKV